MSAEYQRLLSAAIDHLETLKSRGTHFVTVDPLILSALNQPTKVVSAPIAPTKTSVESKPISAPVRAKKSVVITQSTGEKSAKEIAMAELKNRAMVCVKCPDLAATRKNVVFGVGNVDSPLLFVGEAPGAEEDAQGEPFVGKAGELLTKIIHAMGFSREAIYITNVLKCRPDVPPESTENRKPTSDEMNSCLPYLLEQIDIIKPSVIVALGATAVEGLFGKSMPISKIRGTWQTVRDTPVMPTFHPSYLVHNPALSEKRKVWEDMLQVLEKIDAPISEKQRNYFLKA